MVRLFSLLILIAALCPSSANASWSRRAVDYAERNLGYFPGPQTLTPEQRGAIATVWGGGMRNVRFNEDMRNDEQMIKIPGMFRKPIRVHLRTQERRAPLMVVIPGVFADSDESIAKATTKWFSKMGYHVLTMPNCWSRDFAKADPIFTDEYPSGEARAVEKITEWAINEIGAKNVTSVGLFGESLGALTASVVYARDSQLRHPLFTAGATLNWPPIRLYDAIGMLDKTMMETESIYNAKCRHLIKRVKTKWRIMRGKFILEPTKDEVECAPAIVAQYSFRRELYKLAKQVNETRGLRKNVPEKITFGKFVREYVPRYAAALKSNDEYGSLRYWLDKTDSRARENVRIITSKDDFLNDPHNWNQPGFLDSPRDQLIVAHWGGHIGLTDTKEYERLLKVQFELQ